jgi:prepilin-type N-terminal cleavage/methylation domain-containing protein
MKRRAFTLLEILVVLAIIGILAALILPTISRVREGGRAIACASNLKQIGLALMQYSEDYEGFHPVAGATVAWDAADSVTGNYSWMQQLQAYLKDRQVFHCPSDGASSYSYFLSARRVSRSARFRRDQYAAHSVSDGFRRCGRHVFGNGIFRCQRC